MFFDTGHFALETHSAEIGAKIVEFLRVLKPAKIRSRRAVGRIDVQPDGVLSARLALTGEANMMKLLSIQVGHPRKVKWRRRTVTTGIYKDPVVGRIMLRRSNLEGDEQADLRVHGGWDKAVYVYPSEHYAFWRTALSGMDLPYGMFGENFTTEGLDESSVRIGDRFRIGGAVVKCHTTPRAMLQTRRAFWASRHAPTLSCERPVRLLSGGVGRRRRRWGRRCLGTHRPRSERDVRARELRQLFSGRPAERRLELRWRIDFVQIPLKLPPGVGPPLITWIRPSTTADPRP